LTPVLVVTLLALAPAAVAAEGDGRPGARIVNGAPANDGEYPYQAFVLIDLGPFGESYCGGSIVEDRQILTAAHCTTDDFGNPLPLGAFLICVGITDIDNNDADGQNLDNCPAGNRYSVVQNDVHPDYGSRGQGLSHDVAMLRLNRLITSPNTAVIRVVNANETSLVQPGVNAIITGWGTINEDPPGDPPPGWVLREADVPIVSDTTCAQHYDNLNQPPHPQEAYDPPTMLCAGNEPPPRQDTCQGDSGGPLRVTTSGGEPVLIGDTSWGEGCARQDREGVYGDLQAELNSWVHDNIPAARISGPSSATAGQNVTFSQNSKPGGYFNSFAWDLDNANGPSASRVFPAPGNYTVRLRASDSVGHTEVGEFTISISPPPPIADTTPPGVSITFARTRLRRALRRGLRARVRCTERCRVTVVIRISRRLARRLRIPQRVARATLPLGSRNRVVRIRFTRRARRRLRQLRRVTFVARVTASDAAGNRRAITRRVRLRR
jgi:trypsin